MSGGAEPAVRRGNPVSGKADVHEIESGDYLPPNKAGEARQRYAATHGAGTVKLILFVFPARADTL